MKKCGLWAKLSSAPLEKPWANFIGKYCVFVARYPWPFIIFPILLTAFLSTGLFHLNIYRSVHDLYTPIDAIWKKEEAIFGKNWASDDKHFYPGKDILRRRGLYLIIESIDGGNVLRPQFSSQFIKLLDWISTERFYSGNEGYTYKDICLHFQNDCFSNSHARLIAEIFAKGDENRLNITYPIYSTRFATESIDVSKCLGNVTLNEKGLVEKATAWLILYQLKQHSPRMEKLSSNFENTVSSIVSKGRLDFNLLKIYHFHSDTFEQELEKENKRITPMFSITFSILILFSILCTFTVKWIETPDNLRIFGKSIPIIDWVMSKPIMGCIGVISTLMAIISSTGLLLMFNVPFVDMCTVMPFLSLTIGIDDSFLMLAAWHETDRRLSPEERLRKAMRHAAVSITITSLTDALAFLIGAIAPLPAVMYFCYYSSAAICFIFIYCLTIFIACLSLQAQLEDQSLNSVTMQSITSIEHYKKVDVSTLLLRMGSFKPIEKEEDDNNNGKEENKEDSNTDNRMWYQKWFEDKYAYFLSLKSVGIVSAILLITYLSLSIYGVHHIVIGFDLINIVQESSPSRRFLEIRSHLFPQDISLMDIAVMNPPDMSNNTQREQFFHILYEIESTSCSVGRNSTDFWYFSFQKYLDSLGFIDSWNDIKDNKDSFYENLHGFLMANEKFDYDILTDDKHNVKAFRLSTKLTNISTDELMNKCATTMRNICNSSSFSLFTYTPMWNIADQFDIMWPQTMQDIYISIAAMIPIALLFIPQPLCAIAVALNIASIAIGVLGIMTLWGVSLDATAMITIAMSVGFSVDFAAHVSYAYMTDTSEIRPGEDIPFRRLAGTLGAVGWPVSQASLSVFLGISSLSMVDSYIVQTCFKTVLLVIMFGTIHALVFLPLLLMYSHRLYLFFGNFNNCKIEDEKRVSVFVTNKNINNA